MNGYERPELKVVEGMAEGVFMASGDAVVDYSLELSNHWVNSNVYSVTVTNPSSEELKTWSVTLTATSGTISKVSFYNGWFATASLDGNKVTIMSGKGGVLNPGESKTESIQIDYTSDSLTVE